MIDFRYHLVSIIAIFVALAVGIVLGSGPLKGPIDQTIRNQAEQLRAERIELRAQINALKRREQYYSDVTEALAAPLLANRLNGRRVVLVTLPGTEARLSDALTRTLQEAGAVVSGTVALSNAWFDAQKAPELDGLLTQIVPPGTTFPDDAGTVQRANTVLARALVTDSAKDTGQPDAAAQKALAGMEELGYLTVDGQPASRATVALIVAPPPPSTSTAASTARNAAVVDLATRLDGQDLATMVAGAIESSATGGLVRAVRDDSAARQVVSTVDSADTSAGQLAVALGLVEELRDQVEAYGYGPGAGAVLPELASTPSP